ARRALAVGRAPPRDRADPSRAPVHRRRPRSLRPGDRDGWPELAPAAPARRRPRRPADRAVAQLRSDRRAGGRGPRSVGRRRRRLRAGARPVRARVRRPARPRPGAAAMTTREFTGRGWPRWAQELVRALGIIAHAEPVPGGDINEAWQVELVGGRRVFVKSHASPPPGLYAAEADGLAWLAEGPLRVPGVVAVGELFLALEWLELGARGASTGGRWFEEQLGR